MRDFGPLAGPPIYAAILQNAASAGPVSAAKLLSDEGGLGQRVKYRQLVETPSRTTIQGALSLLDRFGWLEPVSKGEGGPRYALTEDGEQARRLASEKGKGFRRILAVHLQHIYVIPGWFVARLHALNVEGQGEIVLPSPDSKWRPGRLEWEDTDWKPELEEQIRRSAERANWVFPGSFPVGHSEWADAVRHAWWKLANVKRRKVSRVAEDQEPVREKPRVSTFSPRARLARAMREAAIRVLFSSKRPGRKESDFGTGKHPISARSFGAWCPRLADLELLFYTDAHPAVWGRLVFPCAAFRSDGVMGKFEEISAIRDPKGRSLWLHQPSWSAIRPQFLRVLERTYFDASRRVGAIYVSLLDVRDEVCRRLRLSPLLFERFLEKSYRECIEEPLPSPSASGKNEVLSISLESDVRPEEQSGSGRLRRPVYISDVPHSLIAIAHTDGGD